MNKDLFVREALAQIPKILALLDRNPHSPTYGCFDYNFWHYKIIDFPNGMAQELVWPLALVYELDLPKNPYYRQPEIRNWVEAGILFAAKSAHNDGACDRFFPYERSVAATAFSLLACIESYTLLKLNNPNALKFFKKRANWLANYQERERLTHHQILIVICLELIHKLLQTERWEQAKTEKLELILRWQNPEGWFPESAGYDPSYHTLTLSCLARLYQLRPNIKVKEALRKAVQFAANFMHPDGSFGGDYTSLNSCHFFPYGFELAGRWLPEALLINDSFLAGLAAGLPLSYADDHIIGHHTCNYLLAWRDYVSDRPTPLEPLSERIWLPNAKILIDRRADTELYLALNKGGSFKLFREKKLIYSDTQVSLQVAQGKEVKNAIAHGADSYEFNIENNEITIRGNLNWANQKPMSSLRLLILRMLMLTIGRFLPILMPKLLQTKHAASKERAPFLFSRQFKWENGKWHVTDILDAKSWEQIISAGIGGDRMAIYLAMNKNQKEQLQPWLDFTNEIKKLDLGEALKVERSF